MDSPRVLFLGIPYFGRLLADLLSERGWDASYLARPGKDPRNWAKLLPRVARADILYLISARIDRRSPLDRILRVRSKPVIVHWVGSDARVAAKAFADRNVSARAVEMPVHWADAPWIRDDLRALGLRVEHVPLPVPNVAEEPSPLPEDFRVLMYLPEAEEHRAVFDVDTILELPGALPDVQFTIFPAHSLPKPLPPNLTSVPWTDDVNALYRDHTVYVRLTTHDGMPFTLVEALSRGRDVVYPRPFPGVTQASGLESTVNALRALRADHQTGELGLNQEGIAYVRDQYDPETVTQGLEERIRALAED